MEILLYVCLTSFAMYFFIQAWRLQTRVGRLRSMINGMVARIGAQSELLSKKAEKPSGPCASCPFFGMPAEEKRQAVESGDEMLCHESQCFDGNLPDRRCIGFHSNEETDLNSQRWANFHRRRKENGQ